MLKIFKTALILFLVPSVINAQNNVRDSGFTETPVYLHTESGVIAGTLTLPHKTDNIAVALIIAGSGPTDRNGNNSLMTNNSLRKLAYAMAQSNIASIRYDKRGVRESARAAKQEWNLRFEDYVADAGQWIEMLKRDKRFSKVIIVGHSEGSLIGMLVADQADQFVSIEGAGRSADKIIREQLKSQPSGIQELSMPILDSLVRGMTVTNVDPLLHSLFRPSVQPYLISWFKYDPAVAIKKLKIPVLIIQGTKDLQVSVSDANLLASADPSAKLVVLNNMNHIFRNIDGDRSENMASYNDNAGLISYEMVKTIVDFSGDGTTINHRVIKETKTDRSKN